ncbi:MAG TPA: hypothetical protein VIJ17_12230 [Pseudolabrys sp.]
MRAAAELQHKGMLVSQKILKPVNLRANAMPSDGYILAVDGKLKTRYETSEEAMTAGSKLKQSFPVIQVAVFDAKQRIYTPVGEQEKAEAQET